jgi:hypothetical protein
MVEKKFTEPVSRKLLKLRNSLYLCLPQAFCQRHGLQQGDKVLVVGGDNLKVVPMESEDA